LRQQTAQGYQRLLVPVFLPEGKAAVDQEDADEDQGQLPHALVRTQRLGEQGQTGKPENERKEMGELTGEPQP